jgi:hypothetical protein
MKGKTVRIAAQASYPISRYSRFTVGRHASGRWVVHDQKGLVGGLFTDRASAIHFALEESDRVPGAVCCAPDDAVVSSGSTYEMRLKNN